VEEAEVAASFEDEARLVDTSAELGQEQEVDLLDESDGADGGHFGSRLN
jgi:hypothetical protein